MELGKKIVDLENVKEDAIPKKAKDVTVGDMIALAWDYPTTRTSKLTVEDIKTVSTALKNGYEKEVSATEVGSSGCCCCCVACCCCCA